ncbi:hypothetical protein ACIHDR_23230 [Nocardia sp. NPDC052278]|uniref:hypothetical protein n=1 Tax=unclassified Nocardia TaxID=2637762 RepID=UPI0036B9F69B
MIDFEELLADRLRILGPDHPETATTGDKPAYLRKQLASKSGWIRNPAKDMSLSQSHRMPSSAGQFRLRCQWWGAVDSVLGRPDSAGGVRIRCDSVSQRRRLR